MILPLPIAWDDDDISTYVRGALGGTFVDDLPGYIDGQSPVNIDFQTEAETYALERRPSRFRRRGGR
jgi:hypothetical protein